MDDYEFKSLYQGHFEPLNYEALEAFLDYRVSCERFDRTVCHFFCEKRRTAIPRTPHERRTCSTYAREQHELVKAKLKTQRPRMEYSSEWKSVSRMTFDEQTRELEQVRQILEDR